MSLGLPPHLASRVVNAGIAVGTHVVAAVVLGAASVAFLILWTYHPTAATLPAVGAIAALASALAVVRRRPTVTWSALYLVVGAAAAAVATVAAADYPAPLRAGGDYLVVALQVVAVMVGGAGGGIRRSLGFTIGGLIAGHLGGAVGAALVQAPPALSAIPSLAALLLVIVYVSTGLSRRGARDAQPDIQRAAQDEKLAEVRSGVESRAAALLHDTILGSLSAIATDGPGPISPILVHRIRADLDAIVGQDWTERSIVTGNGSSGGPVAEVLKEAIDGGLDVDVTGDMGYLPRVDPAIAYMLALALRQLLANVRQHSGGDSAEVVFFGEDATVSVMVIDSGRGFEPTAVAADRFGLRHSVAGRIESVGGTVRVWSTPGKGTSVLLTVPHGHTPPVELDPATVMEGIR